MLQINRKVGERVLIGDDIVIEVMEVTRGRAKIGIQAPREVPVHREEWIDRRLRAGIAQSAEDIGHVSTSSEVPPSKRD